MSSLKLIFLIRAWAQELQCWPAENGSLRAMTSSPMTSNLIGQLSHRLTFSRVYFLTGKFSHASIFSCVNFLTGQFSHGWMTFKLLELHLCGKIINFPYFRSRSNLRSILDEAHQSLIQDRRTFSMLDPVLNPPINGQKKKLGIHFIHWSWQFTIYG